MLYNYNFEIKNKGVISAEFLKRSIINFDGAAKFIAELAYKRNVNKSDLTTVFTDNYGTCSTKHALLKTLAIENEISDIKLILGIVKMNSINTPALKSILNHYNLEFIPEAHCYLQTVGNRLDFTKVNFLILQTTEDILIEKEIEPNQIGDYKINYQKEFMRVWLSDNPQIKYSLPELWDIREKCIRALEY